jgi:hypothetical protein
MVKFHPCLPSKNTEPDQEPGQNLPQSIMGISNNLVFLRFIFRKNFWEILILIDQIYIH